MGVEKIKTREEIKELCVKLKAVGLTIVTTNGSYDILHAGHVRMLEEAKKQGDILIVGLNSDKSVQAYKNKDRPIIPEQYRAELLAALECVDYVTLFDETVPMEFIKSVVPDIHVNYAGYGGDCVEKPLLDEIGAKLHLVGDLCDFSTTKIVDKIIKIYSKQN
ncbi:adenylyltransferase/cytidyltransferase family protein [archaeon]|nr:adenylyltransferase/cytidyltransferase family protein [archaeon]